MNNTTLNTLCGLSKDELLVLSYDFIKLNGDFTNEQIPSFLLEFWAMPNYIEEYEPNDIALLVFCHILDLDFKSKEQMEIRTDLGTYRFSQLFHIFQVILASTIYCRKYHLPIEAFQLFKIEKYNIPQLEGDKELLKEYFRLIKPIEFKKREKAPKKKYQLELSIASKVSNLVFIECFINKLIHHYYLSYGLSERISRALMAAVNHAILYVTESAEEKPIHIGVSKKLKGFNVTILCGNKNEFSKKYKFNPPKPINTGDLKGHYLYSMKSNSDKVSFLDKGAEVTLVFYD